MDGLEPGMAQDEAGPGGLGRTPQPARVDGAEAVRTSYAPLLRRVGLRVTLPRVMVLDVVTRASEASEHITTGEVVDRAREILDGLSVQGVYDCLDALTSVGLVRRVRLPGSPARYETRVADNHHHAICRRCGAVTDVDCATEAAPCLAHANVDGFVVDEAEVTYWGLCEECAAAEGRSAAP